MKKNNLAIIFSHCDNSEKTDILKDTIITIQSNHFDILLVSHLPISIEIQSLVEYFIYDKSNPLLFWPERGMCHWKTEYVGEKAYRMDTIFPDTGWTVFNQMLISSNLALSLDYDYYTLINYDAKLTPSMIKAMNNPSDIYLSRVVVSNDWYGEDKPTQKTFFPGLVFNILSKEKLSKIIPLISKEDYINGKGGDDIEYNTSELKDFSHDEIKHIGFKDSEHYFHNLVSNFKYDIHPELVTEKCGFKPKSERGGIEPFNFNIHNNLFKINIDYDTSDLLIFDVKTPINFDINGEIENISENYFINASEYFGGIKSLGFYDGEELVDLLITGNKLKNSIVTRSIKLKYD